MNEITVKDVYSLPRIEETVDALNGSQYFSTIDVDRAFWQVGVVEGDKCKTAFIIDGQLYEFNVIVLRGLTWHQCLVYIDDVLVFAKTFQEHLMNLSNVLTRVLASGLKLKPNKCMFGDNKVEYLGFSISDKGIRPSQRKIEALMKVKSPTTTKVLNSFLCSINFYRAKIPGFGHLSADLYDMASSGRRMCVWLIKIKFNYFLISINNLIFNKIIFCEFYNK